jgi:hypothetical protein
MPGHEGAPRSKMPEQGAQDKEAVCAYADHHGRVLRPRHKELWEESARQGTHFKKKVYRLGSGSETGLSRGFGSGRLWRWREVRRNRTGRQVSERRTEVGKKETIAALQTALKTREKLFRNPARPTGRKIYATVSGIAGGDHLPAPEHRVLEAEGGFVQLGELYAQG